MDEAFSNFAKNLINLRETRGMSQSQLAKLCGIPRSTLTYFESGEGNPTLAKLLQISKALNVRLEELLSLPRPEVQLVRAGEVPKVVRGKAQMYKLLPDNIPGMEIDKLNLDPGATMAGHPHTKGTKEYFTCTHGKIRIYVGKRQYVLEKGDVLAFPGDQNHAYSNELKRSSGGFSVVCFGS